METQPKTAQSWIPLLKLLGKLLLAWLVFTSVYFGKPIKGWVVDAETGKPIEGAVVVVLYDLQGPKDIMHSGTVGHLHEAEAVTDKNGRYRIPFWGPRLGLWGGIDAYEPKLILFKDGYEPNVVVNHKGEVGGNPFTKRYLLIGSVWNGERLSLKPYRGPEEKYWNTANDAASLIDYVEDCRWERFPLLFSELLKIQRRRPDDYYYSGPTVGELYQDGKCRRPNQVLETK